VARGSDEEIKTIEGVISSRFVTGTMAMLGDGVATTEPAAEQSGHMCEADGVAVRSEQKWNCTVSKTTLKSKMRRHVGRAVACI
jgi:hypothetical protein